MSGVGLFKHDTLLEDELLYNSITCYDFSMPLLTRIIKLEWKSYGEGKFAHGSFR